MKRPLVIIFVLALAAASAAADPASTFRQANDDARAGDYPKAIAGYRALAAGGIESASLYWNWAQAARARGETGVALWALLLPAYWVLHSIAAWRALGQLVTNPSKWEKTPHGLTKHATPAAGWPAPSPRSGRWSPSPSSSCRRRGRRGCSAGGSPCSPWRWRRSSWPSPTGRVVMSSPADRCAGSVIGATASICGTGPCSSC